MDFEEVIRKRHSIKIYQKKDVPDEIINKIIELSNLSPSAGNLQARSIVIIRTEEKKIEIVNATKGQDWILKAPVILIIFANLKESEFRYDARGRNLYALQDATIFAAHLQLIATYFGLATRWVGQFYESKVNKVIGISKEKKPIAIITLGYPLEEPKIKPRKTIKELIIKTI